MVTVADLIKRDVYTVTANDKVRDILRLFVDKEISGAPVVNNEGKLVGIITDADILRHIKEPTPVVDLITFVTVYNTEAVLKDKIDDLLEKPVQSIMTTKVITVTEYASLAEVAQILSRYRFKKVPVVDGRKLVGVVSRGDVVRYLVKEFLRQKQ